MSAEESRMIRCEKNGAGGPIVIFLTSDMHEERASAAGETTEEESAVHRELKNLCESRGTKAPDFLLATVSAADWDGIYSPWPAVMKVGREADGSPCTRIFAGNGRRLLSKIEAEFLPKIRADYPDLAESPVILAGYSLAGLFALWGFYESPVVSGVAACSATLWFEGWQDYMKSAGAAAGSKAYLSLGGKEPKTKDPVMAAIGGDYRLQKEIMQKDPGVDRLLFEWNPGGHFGNDALRVAKGIDWLLRQYINR